MSEQAANQRHNGHAIQLKHGRVHRRQVLRWLADAPITDSQLLPWGSNYTFAVMLEPVDAEPLIAVYKPRRGEIPLWDFPAGTLYKREYAAYLFSRVLGWHFIPPTVIRDGPHGIGTVQLYIEPDETPLCGRAGQRCRNQELRQIALFDLVTNNADRKPSHYFIGRYDRRVWGIDHGLTFHVDPKLRTVLWDFCGEVIDPELLAPLRHALRHRVLLERLLRPYLVPAELERLWQRIQVVCDKPIFPLLHPRRNIPYGW